MAGRRRRRIPPSCHEHRQPLSKPSLVGGLRETLDSGDALSEVAESLQDIRGARPPEDPPCDALGVQAKLEADEGRPVAETGCQDAGISRLVVSAGEASLRPRRPMEHLRVLREDAPKAFSQATL